MKEGGVQERVCSWEIVPKEAAQDSLGHLWLRFLTIIGFRELSINKNEGFGTPGGSLLETVELWAGCGLHQGLGTLPGPLEIIPPPPRTLHREPAHLQDPLPQEAIQSPNPVQLGDRSRGKGEDS